MEVIALATDLEIDDRLIVKAKEMGGHRTKKEAVTRALQEYIRRLEQEKIFRFPDLRRGGEAWNRDLHR